MATYLALKTQALDMVESPGTTDVGKIVEYGLSEGMKYVASGVILRKLIKSGSYAWAVGVTQASLTSFGVTDFETPLKFYVNSIPYTYREYLEYLDLSAVPVSYREGISPPDSVSELPDLCWTLDPSDNIIITPTPLTATLTAKLYYSALPAPYADATVPEIPHTYDSILINAAVLFAKEYIRQPAEIINPYELFAKLDPQIARLNESMTSARKRSIMKIGKNYR